MAFSRKPVTQSVPTYEEIIHQSGLEKNQLDKQCDSRFFLQLSDQVDYWRNYADVLGLKEHEISGIKNDSSLSPRFKCKKMLDIWHSRYGFKATYLELMKAFVTMENAKLAQTVCNLFQGQHVNHHQHAVQPVCMPRRNQFPYHRGHLREFEAIHHQQRQRQKQLSIEAHSQPKTLKGLISRGGRSEQLEACCPETLPTQPCSYPIQLGVLEPVCDCHTCQPLPRTMRALPPPLEVKFPPSMRQEYESSHSSTSVPSSPSQSTYSERVEKKLERSVNTERKEVSEVHIKGRFIMEINRSKVVFTSPMETASRDLGADLKNVTPPESTGDSAGSSDLEELKQSYTSGNYSHLVHPQVIDRLAVEGNQQFLVSETSHFSLVKSSTSDGPVKVGANVRPTVTDPPSGEIEYDNVEDVSPLSSEYEDNADLIPEHKTERPWTVSNNESYTRKDCLMVSQCSIPPVYEAIPSPGAAKLPVLTKTLSRKDFRDAKRPLPPIPLQPASSTSQALAEPDQLEVFSHHFQQRSLRIRMFYYSKESDKAKAKNIASEMQVILQGGSTTVKAVKAGKNWLKKAVDDGVTHYVIVGGISDFESQVSKKQTFCRDFLDTTKNDGKRVSEVVFICKSSTCEVGATPCEFLCLDHSLDSRELGIRVLGHFAATQPIPLETNCSWSEFPQLVTTTVTACSVGVELKTKEVSHRSSFSRITLVKDLNEDCVPILRQKLGKDMHIQSINGYCLDGLGIEEVVQRVHSEVSKLGTIQLMVRVKTRTASPCEVSGSTKEHLPVPLYVLCDNFEVANCLFGSLTSEMEDSNSHMYDYCESVRSKPLHTVTQGSTKTDQFISRKPINNKVLTADYSSSLLAFKPLLSLPTIAKRNYIAQLFCQDFARDFSHVYLRNAGVFLVTISCNDLVADPISQCENILCWLRLVVRQTKCAAANKVVVVGMYDGCADQDLQSIHKHIQLLNAALFESDVYPQLFDQNKYKIGGGNQQCSYVFMFDISQPTESSCQLYICIEQCIDVFVKKAKEFDSVCYDSICTTFDGLNDALLQLSSKEDIAMPRQDQKRTFDLQQKPVHALETLQAYSIALMDKSIPDILLKPQLLIELMMNLRPSIVEYYMDLYQLFNITTEELKHLPVVSKPFTIYILENVVRSACESDSRINEKEVVETICKWAEYLGLMFLFESKKEMFYFIPSLAKDAMGNEAEYYWDEENEQYYRNVDATVLYAYLKFPGNDLFFHQLLATMIKEAISMKMQTLYINKGCQEAILPLYLSEGETLKKFIVMTIYHPLQNVIEFRTRIHTSLKLPFQKAVMSTLEITFSTSQFHEIFRFSDAITLHVPSLEYEKKLTESALWKLQELQSQNRGPDSPACVTGKQLLKTRELTSEVLEEWCTAKSHKYIPTELFSRWAKKLSMNDTYWSKVGAKLNLLSSYDITRLMSSQNATGNGAEVLRLWVDSSRTVPDLLTALRAPDVRLDALADDIENYMLPISDV